MGKASDRFSQRDREGILNHNFYIFIKLFFKKALSSIANIFMKDQGRKKFPVYFQNA